MFVLLYVLIIKDLISPATLAMTSDALTLIVNVVQSMAVLYAKPIIYSFQGILVFLNRLVLTHKPSILPPIFVITMCVLTLSVLPVEPINLV